MTLKNRGVCNMANVVIHDLDILPSDF